MSNWKTIEAHHQASKKFYIFSDGPHTHTHLHLAELTQNRGNHFAAVFTPVQTWKLQHFRVKILRKNDVKEQFVLKKIQVLSSFHTFSKDPHVFQAPVSCRAPAPTKCVWRRSRSGEALSRPRGVMKDPGISW